MTKRRKTHDESSRAHQQDDDYIPLPIQTFLWRQTSPFVRPFLGKARDLAQIEQRDACKLFERIIITNNIWGQSPSLTDAISSIDRWRLIKVSFPFVLQCTASLLNNKLIKDHTFNRMGGNEAKMMYTLQWILMNASEECADSENEAKSNATNAAMAAATAASLLKPSDAGAMGAATGSGARTIVSQGSTSSTSTGQDHHHHQQQQQQTATPQPPASSTAPHPAVSPVGAFVVGLQTRVGSTSSCANQSIAIPATSAAVGTVAAVAAPTSMTTLQMQAALPSSSSVSPIGSSTPTKPATPTNPPSCPSNYLLPISSIQMFVYYFAPIMDGLKHSDFLTSNQRLEIGAALWEPLFNNQLPSINCLTAQVKPRRDHAAELTFFSASESKAAAGKIDKNLLGSAGAASSMRPSSFVDERRRSSTLVQDQAQFGDVFLGGPSQPTVVAPSKAPTDPKSTAAKKTGADHASVEQSAFPSSGSHQTYPADQCPVATYLDVAVLRCLFIADWQESGTHWSISYIANRLGDMQYLDGDELHQSMRPKSKSLDALDSADLVGSLLKGTGERTRQTKQETKRTAKLRQGTSMDQQQVSSRGENKFGAAQGKFLRVEDAEANDNDGLNPPKSPVRRLSFSSGVQTLANQIRKTSKRVKKSTDANEQSGSQQSIHQIDSRTTASKQRRSSSADDLSSSQISSLSLLQAEANSSAASQPERQISEPTPVITVTQNATGKSASAEQQSRKLLRTGAKGANVGANEADQQFLIQSLYSKSVRHLARLTRSQTIPKNLHFLPFETQKDQADQAESVGASLYVDNLGRIDPIVVLKVIHSISRRESACSLRVCDKILWIVSKLISIGVMRQNFRFAREPSQPRDLASLLPTRHEFALLQGAPQILRTDSDRNLSAQQRIDEAIARATLIHKILVDIVIRLYNHLGCPNHCGMESTVDHHNSGHQSKLASVSGRANLHSGDFVSSARNVRSRLKEMLELLCGHNKSNFIKYVQEIFSERPLQQVVDILHSLLGFCRPDNFTAAKYTQGSSAPTVQFMPTSSSSGSNTNEGLQAKSGGSLSSAHSDASVVEAAASARAQSRRAPDCWVENMIVTNSFKQLITRIAKVNKELKFHENAFLYCDIRRLISFTRENYNSVFRSIVLSALIDCTRLMNQQQKQLASDQRRTGEATRPSSEDESTGCTDGTIASLAARRGLKAADLEARRDLESADLQQQPLHSSPQAHGQDNLVQQQRASFGSHRFYGPPSAGQLRSHGKQMQTFGQADGHSHSQSSGILSLSKAKRKLEQVFGGKTTSKTKANSPQLTEEQAASAAQAEAGERNSNVDEASRRASLIGHQSMGSFHEQRSQIAPNSVALPGLASSFQFMRQNERLYEAVQTGMLNFAFLMESCSPADFLDPALLAALLDLRSPIAVRAAIFLECANFVHRCNRGQWPSWMRMNVAVHRGSNAGLGQSAPGGKMRKSSSIQRSSRNNTLMYRAAGRAFYSWAEAIGARLEELLQSEEPALASSIREAAVSGNFDSCELSPNQALDGQHPTDVDFFQVSINGDSSPFALKMAACHVLYEVTTFLRETYRYLPPSIVQHQIGGAKLGDKMSSIYDVSRAVTANRRWSMALSSLGFGQLPATLSAISAGASSTAAVASSGHLRNPTTSTIAEHPERRISFILHETNDEDEHAEQRKQEAQSSGQQQQQLELQPATSPMAGAGEQQQEAMRKMASSRHLSQSSASSAVVVAAAFLRSSGVIDAQTHRRKSIKLKKASQDKEARDKKAKFAQDLDEEMENSSISDAGVRRTDSIRSRRRVSGISERSDTSDRTNNGAQAGQHGAGSDANQMAGAELSGDDSAGNASCEEGVYGPEAAEKHEDEQKIMSNMPWFKAIGMMNSSIDCNCSHFPSCQPNCYKLHQSMCRRLVGSVRTIYEDPSGCDSFGTRMFESRLEKLMNMNNKQRVPSQDSRAGQGGAAARAGSDCSGAALADETASSKRRDKKSRRNQLDSPQEAASPKVKRLQERQAAGNLASLHADSVGGGNGYSAMMMDTVKSLAAARTNERNAKRSQEEPQLVKYIRASVKSLLHCPMSSFLKGAVILSRDNPAWGEMIRFSWNLLLEDDQQISRTAAVSFIISAQRCSEEAARLLLDELASADASRKIAAINKFYVIWDARYQCWPRLEDGAFVHFKMAPPSIEFTLPSPKIAQESRPVVDPPWMPRKTSNVEEVTIGQDQTVQKSFVTATKTRRKQQIEIVTKALREKYDKLREDRENYQITSAPITLYAAYEPTLGNQAGGADEMDGGGGGATGNADEDTQQENRALLQMKTAQALFPTCLCQAAIVLINLLDDSRVTYEGAAVYEVASKVVWSCLVEDPALFLRYFFESLTRQNQNTIFQVLRRLIRFMPRLPPQAAYTLYNYLIGFIIYYIRCPVECSQKLISDTLSVLCLVVPSVYGLFLKDLKQILRKEQCDHNLLITANVPSAKKIIIHGSDSSGIPSQFPIDESTQFYHILVDSLEFFGIDKPKQNEYFLIDVRTNHMHNLHSYVRDYYSFKRSQHPQLQLINMNPNKAFDILQRQELTNQFLELGKVSMSLAIVKSSHMAVQRVLFLHEELMKLPTFPRKALETNFSLFRGQLGHQVFSMDRIHKIYWVRVIARMFELTPGFFLQLGDIQLFLNAISGIFVLHCEEASVSRLCLATFINAAHQFKNIFATDGFMSIMGTIVQVYSNHQNNQLLCRSIEFVCKQFYIMHRKPFLLQLFGSVASRLNTAEVLRQNQASSPLAASQPSAFSSSAGFVLSDPSRISPAAFFRLLQSLEKAFKDPLDILELVEAEKPLRAVDFCYQQDKEAIEILDIISLCVTVTAYASDSPRSTQMLIILESVVPLYMKHLQASNSKKAMGKQAHKDELQKIQSISICVRTLIVNCEGLTRNFNGPLPSIDLRSSSIRRTGSREAKSAAGQQRAQANSAGSPMDFYHDEPSVSGPEKSKKEAGAGKQATIVAGLHRAAAKNLTSDESEITRAEFVVPRDTLLNLVAEFLALSTGRLVESAKKYVDLHQKHSSYELLDVKSHLRLAEIANSLLKFASTDPSVMACRGLIRYMNEILPNTEWRQEAIRPALILILKRLDKTFNRIAKKTWVKRTTDWEGAKQLLKGAYLTFIKHPYIVHLPHLKSLISCCQNIILSDGLQAAPVSSPNIFHGLAGQAGGGSAAGQQAAERQTNGNLLNVAGSALVQSPANSAASVSVSGGIHLRAGAGGPQPAAQSGPSLAGVSAAAALAERLAANAASSSSAVTSQGFNSVTIRLIAMQLLQTGESQTLESLVGNSMNTPEKLESLMLNLIFPMCIRVCSGAREAPKLRVCDIMFILNIVLNMLAPNSASSKSHSSMSNSPKSTTDTSQFILSKITTTIGSTQTGASALGIVGSSAHLGAASHSVAQHHESLKIGFLGLKILCVCFESQLAGEWIRIARVIRDLALQTGQPSGPLWDFLDFVVTYRFPVFILLLPTIKCQLARKVKEENSGDVQCQRLIDAKIHGSAPTVCRSKSFLFVSLTAELRMLKEQLVVKRRQLADGERRSSHGNQGTSSASAAGAPAHASAGQSTEGGPQQGEHFNAYYRLSAALASLTSQGVQARAAAGSSGQQLGTSAALKGACFAAQLATSAPITDMAGAKVQRAEPTQSSNRLSAAKNREEARKVMNNILRRTSYPHNQTLSPPDTLSPGAERKNSQPPSKQRQTLDDAEAGRANQIIMDPAMLMAAFPPKRTNVEGSGILKQLVQTIDRQNQRQQQQLQQQQQQQQQPSTSAADAGQVARSVADKENQDARRTSGQASGGRATPLASHSHEQQPASGRRNSKR